MATTSTELPLNTTGETARRLAEEIARRYGGRPGTISAMEPSDPIDIGRIGKRHSADNQRMAAFYNRFGGYMKTRAEGVGLDPIQAMATMMVESAGEPFVTIAGHSQPIIRFEVHKFHDNFVGVFKPEKPKKHETLAQKEARLERNKQGEARHAARAALFAQHFKFNPAAKHRHEGHFYRSNPVGEWLPLHKSANAQIAQPIEQAAVELAAGFGKEIGFEDSRESAYRSVSFGLGQIMGEGYKLAGYSSATELYTKFTEGASEQIDGYFSFLQNKTGAHHRTPLLALKDAAQNAAAYEEFARLYNGANPATAKEYAGKIQDRLNALKKFLQSAPRIQNKPTEDRLPFFPIALLAGRRAALQEPFSGGESIQTALSPSSFLPVLPVGNVPPVLPYQLPLTPQAGEMTGPFYPRNWRGTRDADRERVISSQYATIFVNGVRTDYAGHSGAAQQIADSTGKPVVGVFNATGRADGTLGEQSSVRDVARALGDKFFDVGDDPSTATIVHLYRMYGERLNMDALSQNSLIVSEALRLARGQNLELDDVLPGAADLTKTNATPDIMPALLGTTSPLGYMMNATTAGRLLTELVGGKIAPAIGQTLMRPGLGIGSQPQDLNLPGSDSVNLDNRTHSATTMTGAISAAAIAWESLLSGLAPLKNSVFNRVHQFAEMAKSVGQTLLNTVESVGESIIQRTRQVGGRIREGTESVLDTVVHSGEAAATKVSTTLNSAEAAAIRVVTATAHFVSEIIERSLGNFIQEKVRIQRFGLDTIQSPESGWAAQMDPGLLRGTLVAEDSGQDVPPPLAREMSSLLGFDPTIARLHTGGSAASAARALNAEAFTIGRDVFFAENRYDPYTPQGQGLLAHELTHVGQQTGRVTESFQFYDPTTSDPLESSARTVGNLVSSRKIGAQGIGDVALGRFDVQYISEEDELTAAESARLQKIEHLAYREAERHLGQIGFMREEIGSLQVSIEIDLDAMGDDEAASLWAQAVVRAAQAADTRVLV